MDYHDELQASRQFEGALGAAFHVLRAALQATGADQGAIDAFGAQVRKHLGALDGESRAVLLAVLEQRIADDYHRGAFDGAVQLSGRMTIVEAHIVHDALAEAGVATRIRHEGASSSAGFPDPNTTVELWVDPRALRRAKSVMAQLVADADRELTCPTCGAENPGNFDTCWQCESPLAADDADAAEAAD